MSTDYVTIEKIPILLLQNFNHNDVTVDTIESDGSVLLTDGENYLWAHNRPEIDTVKIDNEKKKGTIEYSHRFDGVIFTRYGGNNPAKIIDAIENYFDTRLISEHEDEFEMIINRSTDENE